MPEDVIGLGKDQFKKRQVLIGKFIIIHGFNESALALYEWAPIVEELKTLDRKIVLIQ